MTVAKTALMSRVLTGRVSIGRVLLGLAIFASVALVGPNAHAQTVDGLIVASSTVYTPDPANNRIDVSSVYTLTNMSPDEVTGESVRSFFFSNWVVALPANAADFVATSAGQALSTQIDETDSGSEDVVFGSIALPFNLNFQQTVTLEVDFTIPGGEPRADGRVARANDSFLSFSVWAAGDPGQTDVQVKVPDGFTIDFQGDLEALELVSRDGETFYEARSIEQPRDFFGRVFGRNDTGLLTERAELPEGTATVRAWPDDPDWASFVVEAIEDDVPVIEELTGLEWPAGDIQVIETVTPYLYGYGGWFNADSGIIEVGENLERDLILHELAHAWFNDALIDGRWITEGLAEEFASQTIAATGDIRPDPTKPDLNDPLRVPLADWASPWTLTQEDAYAYERYHYNASWWVIREITNEVGLDRFADTLIALDQDDMAFAGEGPVESTFFSTRWWHLFDLLEYQAGATNLDDLFATYVLNPADIPKLDARRETHARYDDFVNRTGSWGSPLVVRNQLSSWNFELADERIADALTVIDRRDEIDELAQDMDLAIVHEAEIIYEAAETSDDLDQAFERLQALHNEVQAIASARGELDRRAAELDVRIQYAQTTLAEASTDVRSRSLELDALDESRAVVEGRAAELGLESPAWPTEAQTVGVDAAMSLAAARLATLDAIAGASERRDLAQSVTQQVGLWGTDLDGLINEARSAFESDDLDDALMAASDAEAFISASADNGRSRVTWAVVLASLTGISVVLFVRRRSKRHRH